MAPTITHRDISRVDLEVVKGDYYDGFYARHLQEEDGASVDYTYASLCAEIYHDYTNTLVTALNTELYDDSGWVLRVWASAVQTDLLTEVIQETYNVQNDIASPYRWYLKAERAESVAFNISADAGVFTTASRHGLAAGDKVLFKNTADATINDNTYTINSVGSSTTFTIDSLSDQDPVPVLGGETYLYKENTIMHGVVLCYNAKETCF